jgi:hypothetical protein
MSNRTGPTGAPMRAIRIIGGSGLIGSAAATQAALPDPR